MTPAERKRIQRLIDRLEEEGVALDAAKKYQEAASRLLTARNLRRALPRSEQVGKVNKMDSQAHAFRTSQGRSKDPLVQAANGARMTLRELADRVGMKAGHLSMARRGDRTIRASVAAEIEQLTGFKASKANWPLGIIQGK